MTTARLIADSISSTKVSKVFENPSIIVSNYTMTSGNNGVSTGPINIADGVTVTIPDGSNWVIL